MAENLSIDGLIRQTSACKIVLEKSQPTIRNALKSPDRNERDKALADAVPALLVAAQQCYDLIENLAIIVQARLPKSSA